MDEKHLSQEQLKQISDVTYLEESSNLRLVLQGIIAITALVLGLLLWSAFVTIQETATAMGQIIPEGEIQSVQHLEGGIVQQVLVKDGDIVVQNQPLVRLSTIELNSERDQLRSNVISMILQSERLKAYINKTPSDPKRWAEKVMQSKYNTIGFQSEINDLIQNEMNLLKTEQEDIQNKEAALKDTLAQRKEKFSELLNKRQIWKKHLELLQQEFDMYEKLKDKNYISNKDYLSILRALNQAKGEAASIESEIEQTKSAISETENNLKEADSTERETSLTELSKTESLLLEVYHKIEKISEQIQRSIIRAPTGGVVKGVSIFAGNVIKPGGLLLEIVPESGKLIGEIKILPRDIGYTRIGQKVRVKITSYDYARYGSIDGELTSISASTFLDADNKPYYKARVSLAKQYLGIGSQRKELKAGMLIEADIITGSKSLLAYLLRPIHRSVTDAFRER
ncbi:MAG: HlyD family type I secretion periplasmic adaptor subunit [Legionella sp.]|nr:HlyD family type I secretion periplasmic adaptor subunit [Legionella sp.]